MQEAQVHYDFSQPHFDMKAQTTQKARVNAEKKAFVASSIGALLFSIIGIIIFLLSKSRAVLLDALISLISAAIALASIWVVSIASKTARDDFPWGLIQARPMLQLFKGIIILGFIISAVLNGVDSIVSGGSEIRGSIVAIYALSSVAVSMAFVVWIWSIGKKNSSPLIRLEIIQWLQDAAISLSIGIAFAFTLIVKHPIIDSVSLYLDSTLVVLIALMFTPPIVRIVISSGKELLLGSPSNEIRADIRAKVADLCSTYGHEIRKCYMISPGGLLVVYVEIFVSDEVLEWDKATLIRDTMNSLLKSDYPDSEVFVSFFPSTLKAANPRPVGQPTHSLEHPLTVRGSAPGVQRSDAGVP